MILEGFSLVLLSACLAYLITPRLAELMHRIGHTRPDVHKKGHPQVAYSGGIAIYVALFPSVALIALQRPHLMLHVLTLTLTYTIAFIVGLVDDFKVLSGRLKTLLSFLTVIPIVIFSALFPSVFNLGRPLVPLLGRLRLTLIYWVLLPFVTAGPANLVNMLDVFNGVMPLSTLTVTFALSVSVLVLGLEDKVLFLLPLLGTLLGYLPYNKLPARVFNGDSGSLLVGAYIGGVAALLNLEFIVAVSLLPHIVNGALVIISARGFREHRQMEERPVIVRGDFKLAASESSRAPVSLTRLILALDGPLGEQQVVKRLVSLTAVSSILAVISAYLIPR
ncbi:MAG: hypothetical protein N3E41_04195 [Thermofilaceae archaeon]|nr:hypothetical protein [Thermofilaceae archaeon]MDW8003670.1 hypothetical protein [Thermofilaceae archaeon]